MTDSNASEIIAKTHRISHKRAIPAAKWHKQQAYNCKNNSRYRQ